MKKLALTLVISIVSTFATSKEEHTKNAIELIPGESHPVADEIRKKREEAKQNQRTEDKKPESNIKKKTNPPQLQRTYLD